MKLLTKEIMRQMPSLYSQEDKGDDAKVVVKFFTPDSNWTWYVTEADAIINAEGDTIPLSQLSNIDQALDVCFFGLVHGFEEEMGYFMLSDLKRMRGSLNLPIERDNWLYKKTIKDVRK